MRKRRPLKLFIPNTITLGNLALGCLAVMEAWNGRLSAAAFYIMICAVMDFLDGYSARMLKAYSEIGKQLDSLADLVSFGVAPGAIAWGLLNRSAVLQGWDSSGITGIFFMVFPLALPVFSAIRLARFNIQEHTGIHFSGMPVPADASAFAALALIAGNSRFPSVDAWILHPLSILLLIALNSGMMVSSMSMFSFKLLKYGPKSNRWRYLYAAVSLLLLIFLRAYGVFAAFLLYVLSSIGMNIRYRLEIDRGKRVQS